MNKNSNRLSSRIANVKPSAIREILKRSSDPNLVAFSAGNPAEQTFPIQQIAEWTAQILSQQPALALQYSVSEGYLPLRRELAAMLLERERIAVCAENILITTGGEQALDLTAKVLCNEGDCVFCESPSFVGALNTFRSYGAQVLGVEMEEDGISLSHLEERLTSGRSIAFLYLIPNFQNPTGITMSLEKRKAVLALAKRYQVPIVEDNPYGELRFAGEPIPTLKSLDTEDLVFYCGSFSKILSPGLRAGYLCPPAFYLPALTVAKQCTDVHTPMLTQLLCWHFLTQFDYKSHIRFCASLYQEKYLVMKHAIEREFPQWVQITQPHGGLFLWCTLPDSYSAEDIMILCNRAIEEKVAIVPGSAFAAEEESVDSRPVGRSFRLNFSTPTAEQIEWGIAVLGKILREMEK